MNIVKLSVFNNGMVFCSRIEFCRPQLQATYTCSLSAVCLSIAEFHIGTSRDTFGYSFNGLESVHVHLIVHYGMAAMGL